MTKLQKNTMTVRFEQNTESVSFEDNQKRVQHVIDSVIRDAADPIVSLMALYNHVAETEIAWVWQRSSLRLIMSSINELDSKK